MQNVNKWKWKISYRLSNFIRKFGYFNRLSRIPFSMPRVQQIEITNFCNLACPMCPRHLMEREVKYMEMGLFKKVVDEMKFTTPHVYLHHFGESLFHPKVYEMIKYVEKSGVAAMLSTNATILFEKQALALLDAKPSYLILSLDGATKETYEKMRKNAVFETVVENIERFMKLRETKPQYKDICVDLQIIQSVETANETEAFRKRWEHYDFHSIKVKKFELWGGQVEDIKSLAFDFQTRRPVVTKRHPCYDLWDSIVVLVDGRVVPCCRDYDGKAIVGDLNTMTIKEVWNSDNMISLRKTHLSEKFDNPLCQSCTDWTGYEANHLYPLNRQA